MSLKDFTDLCHKKLMEEQDSTALDYLMDARGLNKESLMIHKIGYCPYGTVLPPDVRFYGENLDQEDKRDWRYNLLGRVIVPIYDEFGSVVSLATKKPVSKGKYPWWNMPFVKSHVIYLFDKSRKSAFKLDKIYITEGYVDGLILFQNGVTNVGVLMGTAFTVRKIALIARYTNNVCFCFDVDDNKSGQKASDLSIALLNKFGFCNDISVIDHMPVGHDPASYVQEYGVESFLKGERVLSKRDINKVCYRVDNREREAMYAK